MEKISRFTGSDNILLIGISVLILLGLSILRSISPSIFPHYLIFVVLGYIGFYIFLQIDFEILLAFSKHLYILSIFFLILPLIIGQVTRGAIRWIPLGPITIQPSEIVRPFLLLFFANYLTTEEIDIKRLIKILLLIFLPFGLILTQPSLGVAILTLVGITGVLLASPLKKKYFLGAAGILLLLIPILWHFLEPYQKQRITYFLDPSLDPLGAGYNSIQSMIAVGSGKIFGRGLGEGVQTQLAFLPEKHTDFIFAATAEELGLVGASLLLLALFVVLWRLIKIVDNSKGPAARAYVVGLLFALFAETVIHIGMNIGLLPITGVPLPFVSAGGSALLATMMGLAIAVSAQKPTRT